MTEDKASARAEMFASIRRSLGVTGREATRRSIVDERIERAPRGVIPARGQLPPGERLALFIAQARDAQASVDAVGNEADVPPAIARWLREQNLPARLRMGEDPRLAAMPWAETALDIEKGPSNGGDLSAVSHAFAGIAETGTLALLSGPDNPTTLNFLPDNHIVVVAADAIIGDYEEFWTRLRRSIGKGEMPRAVNWITGPSRSADIEQTLFLGAHGPRSLHIVIVGTVA